MVVSRLLLLPPPPLSPPPPPRCSTMYIWTTIMMFMFMSQLLFANIITTTTTTTTISFVCDGFVMPVVIPKRTCTRTLGPTTTTTTTTTTTSIVMMMSSLSAPTPTPDHHDDLPPPASSTNDVVHEHKSITSADEAWRIIDECSVQSSVAASVSTTDTDGDGESATATTTATAPTDKDNRSLLWDAVHYVEQHSFEYSAEELQTLWDDAHGYWQLVLSTGSPHNTEFHSPPWFLPKFQFAMIDDKNFGNGLGTSPTNIWLALKDKYTYDFHHRRLEVAVDEMYILGHKVTNPFHNQQKQTQQQQPKVVEDLEDGKISKKQDTQTNKPPPPTFVLIGSSDKTLLARGNQSGGIAVWSRLNDKHTSNVQSSAYGGQ